MHPIWILITVSFLSAWALTYVARYVAPWCGWIDRPDNARKRHAQPTPLLGGLAVLLAILFGSWTSSSLLGSPHHDPGLLGILASAIAVCGLGLWDDRWPLRARVKFAGQCLAVIPFLLTCGGVEVLGGFGFLIELGPLSIPFTIFWLVACINVVNLLDGMDGLASSIGIIALVTMACLGYVTENRDTAILGIIAASSVAGFLVHNWPPARIFLGDAGSMTIGFLIGALAAHGTLKTPAAFTLVTPLVVLSVPIFDAAMAIIRRKLSGDSIGTADREHFHHRLQAKGYSGLQSLLLIASLCLVTAIAAVMACWLKRDSLGAVMCVSMLLLVIFSGVFGDREMLLVFRHAWAVSTMVPQAHRSLSSRWLWAKLKDANATHRERIAQAIHARFVAAGGRQLCLRASAIDFGPLADTRDTERGPAPSPWLPMTPPGSWEFRYEVLRNDGQQIVIEATGRGYSSLGGERLEDVFRLLDEICRHWPIDDLMGVIPPDPRDVLSPRLVPLSEKFAREPADDALPRRKAA